MNKLFSILLCVSFAVSHAAFANEEEGGGDKKEGEKKEEAKKEEKAVPEWVELQARLQVLKAKLGGKEKTVKDLIAEKQTEKNPAKSVEIFNDLKREHAELTKTAEEYEQLRNVLRYRFPEKGLKDGRTYERVDVKSLEDMEQQAGSEGQLKRALKQVRQQYGSADAAAKANAEKASGEASPKKKADDRSVTSPSYLAK